MHELEHFGQLYQLFASRPTKPHVADEYSQIDRRNIDKVVFDALALTDAEREAVYEAVIDLVEARLKKAKSV